MTNPADPKLLNGCVYFIFIRIHTIIFMEMSTKNEETQDLINCLFLPINSLLF